MSSPLTGGEPGQPTSPVCAMRKAPDGWRFVRERCLQQRQSVSSSPGCGEPQAPPNELENHWGSTDTDTTDTVHEDISKGMRSLGLGNSVTSGLSNSGRWPFKCVVSNTLTLTSLKWLPVSGKNPTSRPVPLVQFLLLLFCFGFFLWLWLFVWLGVFLLVSQTSSFLLLQKLTRFRVSASVLPQWELAFLSPPLSCSPIYPGWQSGQIVT